MNIVNFSPNMLKTFEDCPYKFFLKYEQKLSLPQRNVFEKGKKIHALANYFLNKKNVEKMEKALSAEEKTAWDLLKSNKYFKFDVVNTEYNLSCKVDKYWVGGRLDALVANKEASDYCILDYKTGNVPVSAREDFQTIVYLLCADKFLVKKGGYKELKFVYIGLKKNEEIGIQFSEELKKHYEEKIISVCEKIDFATTSGVFNKNTTNCERCEYCKLCKHV